jgi:hypothetical protein
MPLPALDSQVTQRLSAVSQNAQTASTDAARIATLLAQKSSSGKPLSERNDLLGGSVAGTPFCPYAAATRPAMTVPTDYQKWQASLDVELERLTRWKADLDIPGQTATPTQRVRTSPAAADAAAQLDLLRACSEAARARAKIRDDLEFLVRNTPVDVEVTLTETLDPNKFLVWADTVLTDSKATGVTAIVNQLDPTKRAADEKTAAVSREQAEDAARRAWTDGKKAEIDVAQLADGSADKQKQQLELDLKKRSANRSYAALGWVVPFPEVFP